LPPHAGLGSKTTTLLALAKAYLMLNQKPASTGELAEIAGRGRTSGASVNLIDRGGFLVDGGHKAPVDLSADWRRHLRPSAFAPPAPIPPVLINTNFPPWPILMIEAAGENIHGEPESMWFEGIMPMPVAEARRTAHIVLLHLAPAIAEADYDAFCRAVNIITSDTYYKRKQIARQSRRVKRLLTEGQKRPTVDAIGMTSMGPCCYVFTRRPDAAVSWLEELRAAGIVARYWFTTAQNHAAVFEGVPAQESDERRCELF
jgi:beta-ribofuranosylaminobenzene 5'-phosphate synthase